MFNIVAIVLNNTIQLLNSPTFNILSDVLSPSSLGLDDLWESTLLIIVMFQILGRVAMATLAFSQPEYSVSEGGGSESLVSVCLNLISITEGVSAIEGVSVMIAIIDVRGDDTIVSEFNSTITLESSALGRPVFCALPSFPDDNIVQGNIRFVAFASVFVQGRDSVTFVPERDQAIITMIDDDGMRSRQLHV